MGLLGCDPPLDAPPVPPVEGRLTCALRQTCSSFAGARESSKTTHTEYDPLATVAGTDSTAEARDARDRAKAFASTRPAPDFNSTR
jgi:hypothetical protein